MLSSGRTTHKVGVGVSTELVELHAIGQQMQEHHGISLECALYSAHDIPAVGHVQQGFGAQTGVCAAYHGMR